jgi:hypothetical protein
VSPVHDIRGSLANARTFRSGFGTSPPAVSRRQNIMGSLAERKKTSWPIFLFLTGLVVPWVIPLGPLRMSVYRILLLVMILPSLKLWISGKAGRIRTADIALLLFCLWGAISLVVNNGLALTIQSIGISFVETAGSYFLARCYIRDADDFYNMVKLLFMIVVFLFPFAIVECVTGQNFLLGLFAAIMATQTGGAEAGRSGLSRAYLVFEHPILFGVSTGSVLALAHQVLGYQSSFLQRNLRAGIIGATAFCSLSAGAIIVIVFHGFLLFWNWILEATKLRWKILIGLLVLIYVPVSLIAKRSVLDIAAGLFVFDASSYWFRKFIWQYGSLSTMNHPLFGVGLNQWERPQWMPASIDNFWLAIAVSYGLPATFFILLTVFSVFFSVSFTKGLDGKLAAYRRGFLITILAYFIVLFTVALWGAAYVIFLFLLGSGVWMLDVKAKR